jgi:acetyl-CoA carboxylase carboxyl transferase subunit beta
MGIFGFGARKTKPTTTQAEERPPEKLAPAVKCDGCGEIIIKTILEDHLGVCPVCGYHQQISAGARIKITLDEDSFREHDGDLSSSDPLEFHWGARTYREKLTAEIRKTGMLSAILAGEGKIGGRRVSFAVTDSAFIAGSMGSVVGEKFTRGAEFAHREKIPFIAVSGSGGGARMHEGMYSLMQMAKTAAALAKLRAAGVPYLSVVTDCTMGGVWASWAALGDIILAEPGALVGFTGPRVIKTTINRDLPAGFQRAEFLLAHGQIDQIVKRHELRARLISLLDLLG